MHRETLYLRHIRPWLYPWYYERDPVIGFHRWLRETPKGRAGYQQFRAAVLEVDPSADFPETLDY